MKIFRALKKKNRATTWTVTVHYFGSGITWEETYYATVVAESLEAVKVEVIKSRLNVTEETHTFEWRKPHKNNVDVIVTEKDRAAASQK